MALEFRSSRDDAWYDACVVTEDIGGDRRLRIKFANFTDDHDELFNVKDLTTLQDLDELRSRFRHLSDQLQDSECSTVEKGLLVCAARSVLPDDRRFYDAFIDGVVPKEHRFVKGEQECTCSFILEWIHGPQVGTLTVLALENICRVRLPTVDEEIDPLLISFLNEAKEKIENTFSNSIETSLAEGAYDTDNNASRLRKRYKGSSSQRLDKDTTRARGSLAPSSSSKEMIDNPSSRDGHDMDIGGVPHMIFVENLEKGISSFTIMAFIYQQLSISCQAFVSPSKPSEVYTRGIIMLNRKKNLDKLSEFLGSPDRIIISSRGRPWVVTQDTLLDDTLRALIGTFKLTSQPLGSRTRNSNELKVVISGSQEYRKAKLLKDLFKEFTDHQRGLHKRLLYEEGRILQLAM